MAKTKKKSVKRKVSKKKTADMKVTKKTKPKKSAEEFKIKKPETVLRWDRIIAVVVVLALLIFGGIYYSKRAGNKHSTNPNVLATVNGQEITLPEFQRYYNFFFFIQGLPPAYKSVISKETILNQSINEVLLMDEAKKQGFSVSDSEVNDILNKIVNLSNLTIDNITQILESQNFTLNDLKNFYRKNLLITKLLNKTIQPQININDEEVRSYYDNNNITLPYDQVKNKIKQQLEKEKELELYQKLISNLRSKADIKVNTELLSKIK